MSYAYTELAHCYNLNWMNTQVPNVQDRLVMSIRKCLRSDGLVLLQSNVEAVATCMVQRFTCPQSVAMHRMVVVQSASACSGEPNDPLCTHDKWLPENPLLACSETEAVTISTGRKIWRCLLKVV